VAKELNWVAIGSIAAVAGAIIALVAYCAPPSAPASAPSPQPTSTPTQSTSPQPVPTPSPTPTPPSSGDGFSAPPLAGSAGLPAGCADADAAIKTYNQTVGTTQTTEAAAATQAYQDMTAASTETDESSTYTVMVTLAADFDNMYLILSGELEQSYAAARARTDSDIGALNDVCSQS
jgi:hypothetical protein